jgi:hypothetical protein
MNDRRIEIKKMPSDIVDADSPARLEAEVVSMPRHPNLVLDRGAFAIEPELTGAAWIRRQK